MFFTERLLKCVRGYRLAWSRLGDLGSKGTPLLPRNDMLSVLTNTYTRLYYMIVTVLCYITIDRLLTLYTLMFTMVVL